MAIDSIECTLVKLPERRKHNWATKMDQPIGSHVVIRVETEDGLVGWGETPPIATWGGTQMEYYGETPHTVTSMINEYFSPVVEGRSPLEIGPIYEDLDEAVKGHPYAKAGIDIALHDLAGKQLDIPVYELLGGAYRDEIPVAHSLGIMEIEQAVEEAKDAASEGIKTIKMKAGVNADRDIELMRQLREAVGPDIKIRVDANEGYEGPSEAIEIIQEMQRFGLEYMEQPVSDIHHLSQVAQKTDVPIMADESAWTKRDILRLHKQQASELFSLYVTKPGGLHRAQEVGIVGNAVGMRCDIGGSIEMGIGNAANLHLGAAVPNAGMASVFPVNCPAEEYSGQVAGVYYEDDIISNAFRYANGKLTVPKGPGLGIEVDESKLQEYSVN